MMLDVSFFISIPILLFFFQNSFREISTKCTALGKMKKKQQQQ